MTEVTNDKQEIDSIKINGQVFKVGYDAYASYNYISRISQIKAVLKNGIVIINLYHKLEEFFDNDGILREIKTDKQYLFRTFFAPHNLEIRYKNTGINQECEEAQKKLLTQGENNESIS